jgi:hypothetical protein
MFQPKPIPPAPAEQLTGAAWAGEIETKESVLAARMKAETGCLFMVD